MIGVRQDEITGRFRRITVHQLTIAWWLHIAGHITRRQLRVYFAAHEMAERRRYTDPKNGPERPLYAPEELASLVGGRGSDRALADLRADVRRLAELGLVVIEAHSITFAVSIDQITVGDVSGFWSMFEQMPNRRRTVPVPRRTLRALAAGFSRAVTGVMLALLVRSLFWHRESGTYRVDGRTKGSWIAEVFSLSRRAVTDARATLMELGWLQPIDAPQWELNRWGARDEINVAWTPGDTAAVGEGAPDAEQPDAESASPNADFPGESASPCLNRSSSLSGNRNTRRPAPMRAGPAGVSARNKLGSRKKNRRGQGTGGPNIHDIQPQHMKRTEDLLELHRQAVEAGIASGSEAGRLDFLALAERARAHGQRPGALFYWLLREKKTVFITQADEDAASRRLRDMRDGPRMREQWGGRVPAPPRPRPADFSEEERFVMACIRVANQNRVRDPFELARMKGWTRDRWDAAVLQHETAQLRRWRAEQPSS